MKDQESLGEKDVLRSRLHELRRTLRDLAPLQRQKLAQAVRRGGLREELLDLRHTLDDLRLSVKYLAFDLEATRRENADLRRRLRPGR